MNPLTDSTTPADVQATIAQLWVYPVKSCAGILVQDAELTDTGLLHDRAWMVVDSEGNFVTQRELPRMALNAVESPTRVRVWDDEVAAFDMGDLAAQWFSGFLRPDAPAALQGLRLARFDRSVRRPCSPKWTGGREAVTQFSDGFAVLVTSTASLEELNARLAQGGQEPVTMNRFRPNVVLDGVESHDEDRIGQWRVESEGGEALFDNVKPCARCPIPNIDPATALSSSAVGDALQTYRQDRRVNGAVTFGMNAIPLQGDGVVLRVGQRVTADWRF